MSRTAVPEDCSDLSLDMEDLSGRANAHPAMPDEGLSTTCLQVNILGQANVPHSDA